MHTAIARVLVVLLLAVPSQLRTAQATSQSPPASISSFSIRASEPGQRRIVQSYADGHLTTRNLPLVELLRLAYLVPVFEMDGLPGWALSQRYDVDLQASASLAADAMWPLLRSAIDSHFRIQSHVEPRDAAISVLTVARPGAPLGPGLRPSKLDCGAMQVAAAANGQGARSQCNVAGGPGAFHADGVALPQLIRALSIYTQHHVVDRTGLVGRFDVDLEFLVSANQGSATDVRQPLPAAVQQQWGLQLEESRGPVPTLVFDRIEQPPSQ